MIWTFVCEFIIIIYMRAYTIIDENELHTTGKKSFHKQQTIKTGLHFECLFIFGYLLFAL